MDEIEKQVIQLYLNGNSAADVGKHFGFSHTKVFRILKDHGISRRTKKEALAKYVKYRVCEICGTVFRVRAGWKATTNLNRKTCSDECFSKLMQIIQLDNNNSYWKGGHSQVHYTRIRKEMKESICEKCGKTDNQVRIDTHHIDGNKSNNSHENIQVLCVNCHALEHYEKEDRGLKGWKGNQHQ